MAALRQRDEGTGVGSTIQFRGLDIGFPPPTIEAIEAGFKVLDAKGQGLAYVYGHADPRDASIAKALTLDEARRIAANIAKLPDK